MATIQSGESLASPAGTSGRSEVSEDDEDVAMETDASGRYLVHCSLPFLLETVAAHMRFNSTQCMSASIASTYTEICYQMNSQISVSADLADTITQLVRADSSACTKALMRSRVLT